MQKIISVKLFEAVRALSGLQDDVKNYRTSFIINNEPAITISKVTVEEFDISIPFDRISENETIGEIMNGATGIEIANSENLHLPPEVIIINDEELGYEFNYEAYSAGNGGEHHKILKVIITLSDNDELWHIIISKRKNTNPGAEGDLLSPVKP